MAKLLLGLLWVSSIACKAAVTQDKSADVLWCSNQFVLHGGFCYRYFGVDVRKAFHHAEKLCSRYGSTLVSLHSLQEEQFVLGLGINHSAPDTVPGTGFWIGLNDQDGPGQIHKEGYFKWSGGEEFIPPSSYCRWKPGQPDNRRHLDCVKVEGDGWSMAAGGCAASRLPFVCKKRACPLGEEWRENHCILLPTSASSSNRTTGEGALSENMAALTLLLASVLALFLITTLLLIHVHSRTTQPDPLQHFPT